MAREALEAEILRMNIDLVRGPTRRKGGSDELEALRAAEDILTNLIDRTVAGLVGHEKLRHVRDRLCDKIAALLAPPPGHCACCHFGNGS